MQIKFRIAIIVALSSTAIYNALAQQTPAGVSAQEEAACRSDAIKLCFFSLLSADNLRACLRRNKTDLTPACRKLIESRGN